MHSCTINWICHRGAGQSAAVVVLTAETGQAPRRNLSLWLLLHVGVQACIILRETTLFCSPQLQALHAMHKSIIVSGGVSSTMYTVAASCDLHSRLLWLAAVVQIGAACMTCELVSAWELEFIWKPERC